MLFCVSEVSYILGCKESWLYYNLRMCKIPSIKVLDSWRISEEGLKIAFDVYRNDRRFRITACDSQLQGVTERIALVRQKYAENPAQSPFARIQGRGGRLDGCKSRSVTVARTLPGQLMLFKELA